MKRGAILTHSSRLICLSLLVLLLGCGPVPAQLPAASPTPVSLERRAYTVRQRITLVNAGPGQPEKQNLWVALIRDFPPYQQVRSMMVTPAAYTPVIDEYGNRYAEFDFSNQPAGSTETVEIEYQVEVGELRYDLSNCQGELPGENTQPELHIESHNPQIAALARGLARGKTTACEQVRAFYDYIGNELVYTFNGKNWGAQSALGSMGADCTEYASLLAALSRAQGIPARYFEGLLYLDRSSDPLATVEHAWPEVYLPNAGWVALDPTLGRPQGKRFDYFARYTPDHIIVTLGASPSVLRGSSYWTHLYWPGNSAAVRASGDWQIERSGAGND